MELIDRDIFVKQLEDYIEHAESFDFQMAVIGVVNDLKKQPTVDAEPVKHGKWIYGNDFYWYTASCNECGYQRRTDIKADRWNQWNYCPHCGARMDGDEHGAD